MNRMPDFSSSWDYENFFYLTCTHERIAKFLAHSELFRRSIDVPGLIVECGVFKGASLARLLAFRELFGGSASRRIVAFDVFGPFPETQFDADKELRETFIREAGEEGLSVEQLGLVLQHKRASANIELVPGDICVTIPDFVEKNPGLSIALLNLDTDIYEPAVTILEQMYPRLVRGGILMLDDYGVFPGETKAVDDYFRGSGVKICKLPYASSPSYIIKE